MQISPDEIATAVLAILLAGVIQSFLPEPLTAIEPLPILNSSLAQVAIIAIGAYLVLSPVIFRLRSRLRTRRRTANIVVHKKREKPDYVDTVWEGEKFGVKWVVHYGRSRIASEPYAYAEDPRCPRCDTELMTGTKSRRPRSDKRIWKCSGCGFTKGRPKTFLNEEHEAVEREVERDVRHGGPL